MQLQLCYTVIEVIFMYLDGLDEIDQKIITLLIENARYTYSEIGDRLGLSRVAIKNHIDALEAQ